MTRNLALVTILGTLCSPALAQRTTLCHRTGNGYRQIEVAHQAVGAHLAHGDCIVDDSIACTADSCDAQLGCVHTPDNSLCSTDEDCATATCDPSSGCVSEPQCETDSDCGSDPCIIAFCADGCCAAIDACPPTTGSCRNVTGACDEDGTCVQENEPDGTLCDSTTGSTLCGDNGCDGACLDGICFPACPDDCTPTTDFCRNTTGDCDEDGACIEENAPDGTPCDPASNSTNCEDGCGGNCQDGTCIAAACSANNIELPNGTCAIPCTMPNDCDGTGCGLHDCRPTAEEEMVCVRISSPSFGQCEGTSDCPMGTACIEAMCRAVCPAF